MPRPSPDALIDISFELDGKTIKATARAGRPALDFLRQDCEQKQLVSGCSPQGICGCCAVIVNGKPRLSCALRVKNLNGKSVQTIRTFQPSLVQKLQTAFADYGATQCGYCTPGIILQSAALLSHVPNPNATHLDKALNMHLCRCTGYTKIKEAILSVCTPTSETANGLISPPATLASVGKRTRVADIQTPNMQYAVPVFTNALGHVLSIQEPVSDHPFLFIPVTEARPILVEHAGAYVGFVVSKSLDLSRELASKYQVSIDPISPDLNWPPQSSPVQSATRTYGSTPDTHTSFESVVTLPLQDPAYLEPDAVVCVPKESGYHLLVAGVNPHHLKQTLQQRFDVPVLVESLACGASYGGRDIQNLAESALIIASQIDAPVSIQLSLEQAQRLHPKSPAQHIRLNLSLDSSGAPKSLVGEISILGGAQPPPNLASQMSESICILYNIEHIDIKVSVFKSHHPPTVLLRDKGLTGFTTALENLINQAAAHTGHDPLSYRARYALPEAQTVLKSMASEVITLRAPQFSVALAGITTPLSADIEVKLRMVAGTGIEIHLPIPESGQGLEASLSAYAAQKTGFAFDIFSVVCDSSIDLTGYCHDEDILVLAQRALDIACSKLCADMKQSSLDKSDGQIWNGYAQLSTPLSRLAGALCIVQKDNRPTLHMFSECPTPNKTVEGLLEGAAHMGLSMTLGEALRFDDDGIPQRLLRNINLLKARNTPPIHANLINSKSLHSGGAAQAAAAAATCASAIDLNDPIQIPLSHSPIALAIGIKPKRS